ncbi:hypothetical protein [Nonomuraea sp. NPDC003214]
MDCVTVICAHDHAEALACWKDLGLAAEKVVIADGPEPIRGIRAVELVIVETSRFWRRPGAAEIRDALLPAELVARSVRRVSWPFGAGGAGRPWKRAQLDTWMVLAAVRDHEFGAFGELVTVFPMKVVLAAFRREIGRGRLEYGVAEQRPWLTSRGRAWLEMHR